MKCKYVLGQCCPNANSNASIEIGIRAEGLRAEAVKHDVFIDKLMAYENCMKCMIAYNGDFCLNSVVSAL